MAAAGEGSRLTIGGADADKAAPAPEAVPGAAEDDFKVVPFAPWLTSDAGSKAKLVQWNLDKHLRLVKVSFAGAFAPGDDAAVQQFLVRLLNSPALRSAMPVASKSGSTALAGEVTAVAAQALRTQVTSMTFWDRFVEEGLVTESGYIRKCLDEVLEGATVSDLFREALLNEDSENALLYDDEEREEFIWHLMRAVATGGSMCQYEDTWEAYLAAVKATYKDMLKVYKNATTGKVQVASHVYRVSGATGAALFPVDNSHNALFVAVDGSARTATVWYSAFVPFW